MEWPLYAFMQKDGPPYFTCLFKIQEKAFDRSIADAGMVCGSQVFTFQQMLFHLRECHNLPLDVHHYCSGCCIIFPTTYAAIAHFEDHKEKILTQPPFNFNQDQLGGDELNQALRLVCKEFDVRTALHRVVNAVQRNRKQQSDLLIELAIQKLEEWVGRRQPLTLTPSPIVEEVAMDQLDQEN